MVVGFDKDAEKIIKYFDEDTTQLDVISITGMPGVGKTTLARKIYHDERIRNKFPTRIWIYVSQVFTLKTIFVDIMQKIKKFTQDMHLQSEDNLAETVSSCLESEVFLIVLDDVWTEGDWDKIQAALPLSNKASKVLITSRQSIVAKHANKLRSAHELQILNKEDSWLLLQYEVFGKLECPSRLETLGKVIAQQCGGMPLAIVIIGGILLSKTSKDMTANEVDWKNVSRSVSTYIHEAPDNRMQKIIGLSYNNLSDHLRECFLYLGIFPEDRRIPVRKLISMWIAEGFIQPKDSISLEESAGNYLTELINRNLLSVDKRTHDGQVKTCHIHDMLRDVCKNQAAIEQENFLQEIKMTTSEEFQRQMSRLSEIRRLCIHSDVSKFIDYISSESTDKKCVKKCVRSLVCFAGEDVTLPKEKTSVIPDVFKLVRILDVKPIKFQEIPGNMYLLVHLRFLVLSFNEAILPAHFGKLWNIQTLIVNTTSRTLEIRADIWKMMQLRHLKTNASATLPKPGKTGKHGEKLQTLSTISPQNCKKEFFDKAENLKKLGIRGQLSLLFEGKNASFQTLVKLEHLEKLKLINDPLPKAPSERPLRRLPHPYQFPKTLKNLTLSKTYLEWIHMSTLGLIDGLVVLKLKDQAFMGTIWTASDGRFSKLEVLHIADTNLVFWVASRNHFPSLKFLELHKCQHLEEIPVDLAYVPNFQLLELSYSEKATKVAQEIYEAKQVSGDIDFKLSIFPPQRKPELVIS